MVRRRFSGYHRLVILLLAVFVLVSQAANSCFQTDPPYEVVRGQPFTLTWLYDEGNWYDLSLLTDVGESLGYLARNVSQSSLIWTPPLNVSSGPFAFGLFMWNRHSFCQSANFTISGSSTVPFANPPGSLATTLVTINSQPTTVIATIGTWTPDAAALATPTPTSIDPTSASAAPTESMIAQDTGDSSSFSNNNPLKIGVSIAIVVLVLLVVVLGVLLYRARRKRRQQTAAPAPANESGANASDDAKRKLQDESVRSSAYTAVDELDGAQRSEVAGRERVQLEGRGMPEGWRPGTKYSELEGEGRSELAGGGAFVAELEGSAVVGPGEKGEKDGK